MKTARGLLLAIATYFLTSVILLLVVHAFAPGDFDAQGRLVGRSATLLSLCAHGIACFMAGVVALPQARGRMRVALLGMGGGVFAVVAWSTVAFWSVAPAWYDWTILATTLPFVAIGAAWRRVAWLEHPSTGVR